MIKSTRRKFRASSSQSMFERLASDQGEGTSVDREAPTRGRSSTSGPENVSSSYAEAALGGQMVINGRVKIEVVQGDITEENTEAIVNSTDDQLGLRKQLKEIIFSLLRIQECVLYFCRIHGFPGYREERWTIHRKCVPRSWSG